MPVRLSIPRIAARDDPLGSLNLEELDGLFREVGFTLADIGSFLAADEPRSRQAIIDRKLAQVLEQQRQLEVAREVLEHGRHCPAGDPMSCSRFWSIVEEHLHGLSLEESHASVH